MAKFGNALFNECGTILILGGLIFMAQGLTAFEEAGAAKPWARSGVLGMAVLINGIVWLILDSFVEAVKTPFLVGLEMSIWGALTLLICLVLLKTLLNVPTGFPNTAGLAGKIGIILSICGAILSLFEGILFAMFFPSWCRTFVQWCNIMVTYSGYALLLIMIFFVALAGGAGVANDQLTDKLQGKKTNESQDLEPNTEENSYQ